MQVIRRRFIKLGFPCMCPRTFRAPQTFAATKLDENPTVRIVRRLLLTVGNSFMRTVGIVFLATSWTPTAHTPLFKFIDTDRDRSFICAFRCEPHLLALAASQAAAARQELSSLQLQRIA